MPEFRDNRDRNVCCTKAIEFANAREHYALIYDNFQVVAESGKGISRKVRHHSYTIINGYRYTHEHLVAILSGIGTMEPEPIALIEDDFPFNPNSYKWPIGCHPPAWIQFASPKLRHEWYNESRSIIFSDRPHDIFELYDSLIARYSIQMNRNDSLRMYFQNELSKIYIQPDFLQMLVDGETKWRHTSQEN